MSESTNGFSDERKLRRFAMDVVRAMAEETLSPMLARSLALEWGLLETATDDATGGAWLRFTETLLGDELERPDDLERS